MRPLLVSVVLAAVLAGTAAAQPAISVAPATLAATAPAGQTVTATLEVRNDGTAPLTFALPQVAAAVPAGASAPDGYGYRWTDSDSPGGPAFEALDISPAGGGLGTALAFGGEDFVTVALPFAFPFYGARHPSVRVYTDGFLTFDDAPIQFPFADQTLPDPTAPNNVIAAFWNYVGYSPSLSRVYTATLPDGRFIVQYDRVWQAYPSSRPPSTAQIILSPDGEITLQYPVLDPNLNYVGIGIENADGTEGLHVRSYPRLHEGLAIQFSERPPFVTSATPSGGTVAPGASASVAVTLSAAGLTAGSYAHELLVASNAQGVLGVPLALSVTGEGRLAVTPSEAAFGPVATGETRRALVTLHNTGANTVQVGSVAATGTGFTTSFSGSLTLAPGEQAAGVVSFAPTATGAVSGALTVTSDSPETPTITVALSGEGILAPALAWSPAGLAATAPAGGMAQTTLTLQNTGAGPLAFTFPDFEAQRRFGGPDASGHWWSDSDDAHGPDYAWIDVSATATRVAFDPATGDDHVTVPLPFAFPFYGQSKTVLGINGNGFLAFGAVGSGTDVVFPDPIPTPSLPNDLIAVYWGYLYSGDADIYYQDLADGRFVVTWENVPNALDPYRPNTFQAVLHEDGTVLMQYRDITSTYSDAVTVGIENADGTEGLRVAQGEAYVESGLAVRISTGLPLVSGVTPASGTVPPGGALPVTVSFSADTLNAGTYAGGLRLHTNDPAQRYVSVPTTLVVDGTAALTVTPEALAFGSVVVGQSRTAVVTVANAGTEALQIAAVTAAAPFSVSPAGAFALAPGASRVLTVAFAPTATGAASGALALVSGSPDVPSRTVALAGAGTLAPALVVSPASLAAEAAVGQTVTATLTLQNTGAGPLDYRFPQFPAGARPGADSSAARGAGGPDGFGYRWSDSREPNGPAFEWIDISAVGTPLDVGDWDGPNGAYVPLPFPFFFYGKAYDEVGVFQDGFLVFEPVSVEYGYTARPIPNAYDPNGAAGVFWRSMGEGGQVHTATLADGRFVVQWTDVPSYSPPAGTNTFQAILDPAHGLTFQYLRIGTPPDGNSVTVGIENATGTGGLTVAHSGPQNDYDPSGLPTSGRAVRITAPTAFLTAVEPPVGSVAPGASAEVTVRMSAEGLVDGAYAGLLVLTSNDPDRARVDVPVSFAVSGAPAVAASPAALDFGSLFVGTDAEAEVVVTNAGTQALVVSAVEVAGAGFSVTPAAGFTLAPFASDTLTVAFAPAGVGAQTGVLTLRSNAAGVPALTVALAGTGTPAPVAAVSAAIIPATVPQGQTAARTFTLSNTGGSPMAYTVRVVPGGLPLPEMRGGTARGTSARDATRGTRDASARASGAPPRQERLDAPAARTIPDLTPLALADPGDVVYASPFNPTDSYDTPSAAAVTPDGSVYVTDEDNGWTVRYSPTLTQVGRFRHPIHADNPKTRGIAYNEDTQTLWYLNATKSYSTYLDYDPHLVEADLDGTPTGRVVPLPQALYEQYNGLSYNERTGHFYTLDTYDSDIYAFTPAGAVVAGYPVPQSSGDDGDVPLYGLGVDAWGDYLDVPFGRAGISRIAVTDLAGADAGPPTPMSNPDLEYAGRVAVRSRTQPNALMYTLGSDAVYAFRPVGRNDLEPFVRVTTDSAGVLAPGASVEVGIVFDPLDLPVDFFARRVRIETDSPVTPSVAVTAQMLVVPPGATAAEGGALPTAFALERNHPNPFARATRIRYALAADGPVSLRVYDALGRLVATLVDGVQPAGFHEATWDSGDAASGVYVYRIEAGDFRRSERMVRSR